MIYHWVTIIDDNCDLYKVYVIAITKDPIVKAQLQIAIA